MLSPTLLQPNRPTLTAGTSVKDLYSDLVLKCGIIALDRNLFRMNPSLLVCPQTTEEASVTNLMWRFTLCV